eukprot:PLAT7093.3.p1 GENE.PLAT7093.3~~PLAT7093.3.p1  ORF type:complete len:3832 (-),score=1538.05 PLAT7093.3:472-11967(-)
MSAVESDGMADTAAFTADFGDTDGILCTGDVIMLACTHTGQRMGLMRHGSVVRAEKLALRRETAVPGSSLGECLFRVHALRRQLESVSVASPGAGRHHCHVCGRLPADAAYYCLRQDGKMPTCPLCFHDGLLPSDCVSSDFELRLDSSRDVVAMQQERRFREPNHPVEYGDHIQLEHLWTGRLLSVDAGSQSLLNSAEMCLAVELAADAGDDAWFTVRSTLKLRAVGDPVKYGDLVFFSSTKWNRHLHVSSISRWLELNLSGHHTLWRLEAWSDKAMLASMPLRGGDVVRFVHKQTGGYLMLHGDSVSAGAAAFADDGAAADGKVEEVEAAAEEAKEGGAADDGSDVDDSWAPPLKETFTPALTVPTTSDAPPGIAPTLWEIVPEGGGGSTISSADSFHLRSLVAGGFLGGRTGRLRMHSRSGRHTLFSLHAPAEESAGPLQLGPRSTLSLRHVASGCWLHADESTSLQAAVGMGMAMAGGPSSLLELQARQTTAEELDVGVALADDDRTVKLPASNSSAIFSHPARAVVAAVDVAVVHVGSSGAAGGDSAPVRALLFASTAPFDRPFRQWDKLRCRHVIMEDVAAVDENGQPTTIERAKYDEMVAIDDDGDLPLALVVGEPITERSYYYEVKLLLDSADEGVSNDVSVGLLPSGAHEVEFMIGEHDVGFGYRSDGTAYGIPGQTFPPLSTGDVVGVGFRRPAHGASAREGSIYYTLNGQLIVSMPLIVRDSGLQPAASLTWGVALESNFGQLPFLYAPQEALRRQRVYTVGDWARLATSTYASVDDDQWLELTGQQPTDDSDSDSDSDIEEGEDAHAGKGAMPATTSATATTATTASGKAGASLDRSLRPVAAFTLTGDGSTQTLRLPRMAGCQHLLLRIVNSGALRGDLRLRLFGARGWSSRGNGGGSADMWRRAGPRQLESRGIQLSGDAEGMHVDHVFHLLPASQAEVRDLLLAETVRSQLRRAVSCEMGIDSCHSFLRGKPAGKPLVLRQTLLRELGIMPLVIRLIAHRSRHFRELRLPEKPWSDDVLSAFYSDYLHILSQHLPGRKGCLPFVRECYRCVEWMAYKDVATQAAICQSHLRLIVSHIPYHVGAARALAVALGDIAADSQAGPALVDAVLRDDIVQLLDIGTLLRLKCGADGVDGTLPLVLRVFDPAITVTRGITSLMRALCKSNGRPVPHNQDRIMHVFLSHPVQPALRCEFVSEDGLLASPRPPAPLPVDRSLAAALTTPLEGVEDSRILRTNFDALLAPLTEEQRITVLKRSSDALERCYTDFLQFYGDLGKGNNLNSLRFIASWDRNLVDLAEVARLFSNRSLGRLAGGHLQATFGLLMRRMFTATFQLVPFTDEQFLHTWFRIAHDEVLGTPLPELEESSDAFPRSAEDASSEDSDGDLAAVPAAAASASLPAASSSRRGRSWVVVSAFKYLAHFVDTRLAEKFAKDAYSSFWDIRRKSVQALKQLVLLNLSVPPATRAREHVVLEYLAVCKDLLKFGLYTARDFNTPAASGGSSRAGGDSRKSVGSSSLDSRRGGSGRGARKSGASRRSKSRSHMRLLYDALMNLLLRTRSVDIRLLICRIMDAFFDIYQHYRLRLGMRQFLSLDPFSSDVSAEPFLNCLSFKQDDFFRTSTSIALRRLACETRDNRVATAALDLYFRNVQQEAEVLQHLLRFRTFYPLKSSGQMRSDTKDVFHLFRSLIESDEGEHAATQDLHAVAARLNNDFARVWVSFQPVAIAQSLVSMVGGHEAVLSLLRRYESRRDDSYSKLAHAGCAFLIHFVADNMEHKRALANSLPWLLQQCEGSCPLPFAELVAAIVRDDEAIIATYDTQLIPFFTRAIVKRPRAAFLRVLQAVAVANHQGLPSNQISILRHLMDAGERVLTFMHPTRHASIAQRHATCCQPLGSSRRRHLGEREEDCRVLTAACSGGKVEEGEALDLSGSLDDAVLLLASSRDDGPVRGPPSHVGGDLGLPPVRLSPRMTDTPRKRPAGEWGEAVEDECARVQYKVALIELLSQCSLGENFEAEAQCRSLLPMRNVLEMLRADVPLRVRHAYLHFLYEVYMQVEVSSDNKDTKSMFFDSFGAQAHWYSILDSWCSSISDLAEQLGREEDGEHDGALWSYVFDTVLPVIAKYVDQRMHYSRADKDRGLAVIPKLQKGLYSLDQRMERELTRALLMERGSVAVMYEFRSRGDGIDSGAFNWRLACKELLAKCGSGQITGALVGLHYFELEELQAVVAEAGGGAASGRRSPVSGLGGADLEHDVVYAVTAVVQSDFTHVEADVDLLKTAAMRAIRSSRQQSCILVSGFHEMAWGGSLEREPEMVEVRLLDALLRKLHSNISLLGECSWGAMDTHEKVVLSSCVEHIGSHIGRRPPAKRRLSKVPLRKRGQFRRDTLWKNGLHRGSSVRGLASMLAEEMQRDDAAESDDLLGGLTYLQLRRQDHLRQIAEDVSRDLNARGRLDLTDVLNSLFGGRLLRFRQLHEIGRRSAPHDPRRQSAIALGSTASSSLAAAPPPLLSGTSVRPGPSRLGVASSVSVMAAVPPVMGSGAAGFDGGSIAMPRAASGGAADIASVMSAADLPLGVDPDAPQDSFFLVLVQRLADGDDSLCIAGLSLLSRLLDCAEDETYQSSMVNTAEEETEFADKPFGLADMQTLLNSLGAGRMVIGLCSSRRGRVLQAALRFAVKLLKGGNRAVQRTIHQQFVEAQKRDVASRFFEHMYNRFGIALKWLHSQGSIAALRMLPRNMQMETETHASYNDIVTTVLEGPNEPSCLYEVCCFLQLLSEGHFKPIQDVLRMQRDSGGGFNLVEATGNFLTESGLLDFTRFTQRSVASLLEHEEEFASVLKQYLKGTDRIVGDVIVTALLKLGREMEGMAASGGPLRRRVQEAAQALGLSSAEDEEEVYQLVKSGFWKMLYSSCDRRGCPFGGMDEFEGDSGVEERKASADDADRCHGKAESHMCSFSEVCRNALNVALFPTQPMTWRSDHRSVTKVFMFDMLEGMVQHSLIAVVHQLVATLTEFVQGPNVANQQTLAFQGGLVFQLSGLLRLPVSLTRPKLWLQLRKLQNMVVVFFMGLLEGNRSAAAVRSMLLSIGQQGLETLMQNMRAVYYHDVLGAIFNNLGDTERIELVSDDERELSELGHNSYMMLKMMMDLDAQNAIFRALLTRVHLSDDRERFFLSIARLLGTGLQRMADMSKLTAGAQDIGALLRGGLGVGNQLLRRIGVGSGARTAPKGVEGGGLKGDLLADGKGERHLTFEDSDDSDSEDDDDGAVVKLTALRNDKLLSLYSQKVVSIEVLRDGQLERVYFRVPEHFLVMWARSPMLVQEREKLLSSVARDESKIEDFFFRAQKLGYLMEHHSRIMRWWVKPGGMSWLNLRRLQMQATIVNTDRYWLMVTMVITVLINVALLFGTSHFEEEEEEGGPTYGFRGTARSLALREVIIVLGIMHIGFSVLRLLSYSLLFLPVLLHDKWTEKRMVDEQQAETSVRQKRPSKRKRLKVKAARKRPSVVHPQLATPRSVDSDIPSLPDGEGIVIEEEEDLPWHHRFTRLFNRRRLIRLLWSLKFVFGDGLFLFNLGYLALGVVAVATNRYLWFAFHIFDIFRVQILKSVLMAVQTNLRHIVYTLVLGVFIIYAYSILGFIWFHDDFQPVSGGEARCGTLVECFLFMLDKGTRNGGGIGDVLREADWDSPFYGMRLAYDISFFLLIVIIMIALISGVIIDAFGEYRDHLNQITHDNLDRCFICGVSRERLEREGNGFILHTKRDHNMWHYMFFILHLNQKEEINYTGQESYIAEKMRRMDLSFFPVNRALCLPEDDSEKLQQLAAVRRTVGLGGPE